VINAQDVKRLREKTGAGIMDCKKALIESDGDFEKAIKYLKEKGLAEAGKRSEREAKEGIITVVSSEDGRVRVMAEINCETDFVSRTDDFQKFVNEAATGILESGAEDTGSLSPDIEEKIKDAIASFGENIIIRRMVRFEKADDAGSEFTSYIHLGGKVGVLVEFLIDGQKGGENADVEELEKNIALQIASMAPIGISQDDIPTETVEEQRGIYMVQARESGKPEHILEKIAQGRMKKFFAESCLLEQKYVKDGDLTVEKYLKSVEQKTESKIVIKRFARFKLGEE